MKHPLPPTRQLTSVSSENPMNIKTVNPNDFAAREIKFAPVALETIDKDGVFEGYASLFNTMDLGRDIVRPGAFNKSLRVAGSSTVKLLYQHDPREPIGVWDELREDRKGLFVRGRLLPEIRRAKEVMTLMRLKALDGLSIGFKARRTRPARGKAARELLEIELYEISIVTFPMHPAARAAIVEGEAGKPEILKPATVEPATQPHLKNKHCRPAFNGLPSIRQFEQWLTREAGFTRSQARQAINQGFKSLALTQDAEPASTSRVKAPEKSPAAKLRRAASAMRRTAHVPYCHVTAPKFTAELD
ncbi:MAG: hypothetical protein DHS20C08_02840 [Rhodomicrobium sp.]|nr:MAG: hypothetical protein DHS20C08_02840 [Rhodomicrobium sp.]